MIPMFNKPVRLQDHMLSLGRLHVKKGVDRKYLDVMGPTFCQAIRPMVMDQGNWSLDIEAAWLNFFKILVAMMKVAYTEKEPLSSFPSQKQTRLLLNSWENIETQLDEVGVETFRKLFESHSDIQSYFPAMKRLSEADLEIAR